MRGIHSVFAAGMLAGAVALTGCDASGVDDAADVEVAQGALEDASISSLFTHAKGGCSGGEFPVCQTVYATFVRHGANNHPPGDANASSDLVIYANGPLKLSADKKSLSGELRGIRNRYYAGGPGLFGSPPSPSDHFQLVNDGMTFLIQVTDAGQALIQPRLNGVPIGGIPLTPMKAAYSNSVFVESGTSVTTLLSFTLN